MILICKQIIPFCSQVGIIFTLLFSDSFAGSPSTSRNDTLFFLNGITGLPVQGVELTNPAGNSHLDSTHWIILSREDVLPLSVSAPNYESLVLDSIPDSKEVILSPIIYPAKKVIIREPVTDKDLKSPVKTFLISENILNSAESTRQLIEKFPGVIIRSYGGKAGVSTLSVHGGQSHRFVVQFDGIPINNEQNGGADISTIPSFLISQMEYLPQGYSSRYGPSAMTGILQVTPTMKGSKIQLSTGNFGHKSAGVLTHFSPGISSVSLGLGFQQFNGDFTYIEKGNYSEVPYQKDTPFPGLKNQLQQQYIYSKILYPVVSQFKTSISLYHVGSRRNLSTNVFASPILTQKMSDSLTIFSMRVQLQKLQLNMSGKLNQISYLNDHHRIFTQIAEIIYLFNGGDIRYTVNHLKNQSTRSLDTNTTRQSISATYTIQTTSFQYSSSVRTEFESRQPNIGSFDAVIKKENTFNSHALTFSRNYKKPNFNDLFWEPFGNPNLQTEYSSNFYYQYSTWKLWGHLRVGSHYILFQDLINWRPMTGSNAYWIPENISSAVSYGFDLWSKKEIFNQLVLTSVYSFSQTENYNNSLDKVHQGKNILYTPVHTASMDLRKMFNKGEIGASLTFTGERLYRYNWPKDNILPSHLLANLQYLHRIFTKDNWEGNAILSIENLFHTQYQNMYGFPDPGRSITCTITLNERK